VLFDAVVLALTEQAAHELSQEATAIDFLRDAFGHLKVIGHTSGAGALLAKAGIEAGADRGLVVVDAASNAATFVNQAKQGKVWERESKLRRIY
jgi:catalase